ncbi:Low density lipoprotein receptor adapter protein 1-B [Sarcoptes scabiei]|uniref:Low density lipoprotein receptor adapter protein 1-B n=1 Tax=Sarcoptes scabiei TaxID=52283 RepID=A0A834VEV9_SARSC|nr:Low density lipoprotein receptor adapter protein 1-B [Sarcoptes scabiei]
MNSIWRSITSPFSNNFGTFGTSKFKKLIEEIKIDPNDSMVFVIRYLGYIPAENVSDIVLDHKTIKTIIMMMYHKNVLLRISTDKITIKPIQESNKSDYGGDEIYATQIPLDKISYCFVDSQNAKIIAFVAYNPNGFHECHAFLADKSSTARTIALTFSKAFIEAFDRWAMKRRSNSSGQNHLIQFTNHNNNFFDDDDDEDDNDAKADADNDTDDDDQHQIADDSLMAEPKSQNQDEEDRDQDEDSGERKLHIIERIAEKILMNPNPPTTMRVIE